MKKCLYIGDEYYKLENFELNGIYLYNEYDNFGKIRYKIYRNDKSYSTVPDFIFHSIFVDLRSYNMSKLLTPQNR